MAQQAAPAATATEEAADGSAPAARNPAEHEEWLLDESLGETFPASDPISPAMERSDSPGAEARDPAPR